MKKLRKFGISFIVAVALAACGGGGSTNSDDSNNSRTYKGFGSYWEVTLNSNNSFNLKRKLLASNPTYDIDIDGTYNVINSTKFLDMLVTNVTTGPVDVNDTGIAIEVPNFGLFVHYIDLPKFVPMVDTTTCPTSTTTYNTITVNSSSDIKVVTYNPTAGSLNVTTYDDSGNYIMGTSTNGVTCTNGVINFTLGGDPYEGYISVSGAFSAKNLTTGELYYGVKQQSISSNSVLDGTYSGMHFSYPLGTMIYIKAVAQGGDFDFYQINKNDLVSTNMGVSYLQVDTSITNLPTGFIKKMAGSGLAVVCAVGVNINPGKNLLLCKEGGSNYILYSR